MKTREQMDEFERALLDDDGSIPESWKPEVGEMIVGTLVRCEEVRTDYGTPLVAVLDEGGDGNPASFKAVWITSKVLMSEFTKRAPKIGERVGVKRLAVGSRHVVHAASRSLSVGEIIPRERWGLRSL
jgi:hypothetical protein